MQRRQFIQSVTALSALSVASLSLGSLVPGSLLPGLSRALPSDHRFVKQIGLQLWTVRNQIAADMPETIKAIAAAGYYQIELSDVMKSDDITKAAEAVGLHYNSSFLDWNVIGQPEMKDVATVEQVVEKAHAMKLRHLVFGYIGKGHRETSDHYRRHAEHANKAGEMCKAAGIQLNYHNHSFEFAKLPDGTTGFDVFVKEFDKELVKFELDVFWVQIGGRDAINTINQLSGRIAQLHLKDLKKGTPVITDEGAVPANAFKELGAGTIDMAAAIKAGDEAGVEQCHVEQDQSDDPLRSIGQSMMHLKMI